VGHRFYSVLKFFYHSISLSLCHLPVF